MKLHIPYIFYKIHIGYDKMTKAKYGMLISKNLL